MRQLTEITVGQILNDLWEECKQAGVADDKLFYTNKFGRRVKKLPITRLMFLKLEQRLNFPVTRKKKGRYEWRIYSVSQYQEIKAKIKEEYNDIAQLLLP